MNFICKSTILKFCTFFFAFSATLVSAQLGETEKALLGTWQQTKKIYQLADETLDVPETLFTLEIREDSTFIKHVKGFEQTTPGIWSLEINEDERYLKTATHLGMLAGIVENTKIIELNGTVLILEESAADKANDTAIQYHYQKVEAQKDELEVMREHVADLKCEAFKEVRSFFVPADALEAFSEYLLTYLKSEERANIENLIMSEENFTRMLTEEFELKEKPEDFDEKVETYHAIIYNTVSYKLTQLYEEFLANDAHGIAVNRLMVKDIFIIKTKLTAIENTNIGNRIKLVIALFDGHHYLIFKFDTLVQYNKQFKIFDDDINLAVLDTKEHYTNTKNFLLGRECEDANSFMDKADTPKR